MQRDFVLCSIFVLTLLLAPSAFGQSAPTKTPSNNAPPVQSPVETMQASLEAEPGLFPAKIKGKRIYQGKEVDQRARLNKKPEPTYTSEAEKRDITGYVVLQCVFDSTGHLTHIKVVSGLPYGLNDRAVEAAKKIQFTPAKKNGHPVSMWMELQYNFQR